MEPADVKDTVTSDFQDFISINQKITLPQNYKKFSTLKLRIKPAKLIFVTSGIDSKDDRKPFTYISTEQNAENSENEIKNEKHPEECQKNFKLDSSYLFRSAEDLCVLKDHTINGTIPTNFKINPKSKRFDYRTENQTSQTRLEIKESEPNEDCEIVKELVLEKFKDLLQKFIEKSNGRKVFSMDQEDNLRGWSEYESIHILDPFIFNLQQEVNQQLRKSHNESIPQTMEQLETKNETETAKAPCDINKARRNIITQGEENLLESQSAFSEHNSRKEYHPNYVHISEPMETVETLQYIENKGEIVENQSIVSFHSEDEPDDKNCDIRENKLKDEINEQTCAIIQVLKILSMCDKDKKLSESVLRVEAERVFLIATLRREIFKKELTNQNCDNEDDKNGFVLISGLRIPLDQTYEVKTKQTRFFICVLRCGSTVLCSDLLVPNRHMELEVGESFCFEELPTNFEISVEIYSMLLKIREKSSGVRILKKYRNFFFGLRSRFRNSSESTPRENSTKRKSAFTLIGKTVITKSKLQLREFSLENINPLNFNLKELRCNIGSGVKLDIFLSGFLMVCDSCSGKTRWRRQWCILDASELKFWDYPGREQTTEPNRIIDLSRSLLPYIVLADRKFCSRPRSLHLKIGPDSAQEEFYHKDIFLAADNPRDFLFWEKELNRVLKNLINWGCMKTYFENSL